MSARERLRDVDARPATAAQLAREGDPAVLPDLVAAFDEPVELGGDALLDAMQALGGGAEARRLARSVDADERRVAARLMSLLPEREHVAALERLVADPDPGVAATARSALGHQWRTPEWHAAVGRLARADDPELAAVAEQLRAEPGG
jgi:hypothetical protein